MEFDNAEYGTIGLESMFGALNSVLELEKTIEVLTKGRENFGIAQPLFKEGEIAALTLFDPTSKYEFSMNDIFSTSKNSLFVGKSLKGKVLGSISKNGLILNS